MNIKIDINVCRVCLKPNTGVRIVADVAEKFQYATLVQVSLIIYYDNYVLDLCLFWCK